MPPVPPDQIPDPRRFLTAAQVCARYGITTMSLHRWLNDAALAFPRPTLRIRDRRFWLEAGLIEWERAAAARAYRQPPLRGAAERSRDAKRKQAASA